MKIGVDKILSYRLRAHHLDRKLSLNEMIDAAGACGLQNTPPGSWETSLFNRLAGCTTAFLRDALYEEKTLLQAWSYRGAPVVFPLSQSDIFLTALIAQEGEQPWIYTRGITGALEYLGISFDDALSYVKDALKYLDSHTIESKEALDHALADVVYDNLPKDKQVLWLDPSMYGNPEKQTVGEAAVSFLLRPCSFHSLVVFGERRKASPTFTSFENWVGRQPCTTAKPEKELMRKYLHCYGPATVEHFKSWLGCSTKQADRLWSSVLEEIESVKVGGETRYILSADKDGLISAERDKEKLLLLGPHDPYLDARDRTTLLDNKELRKKVWRYSANPGAVIKGGRVVGIWKTKTLKDKVDISIETWQKTTTAEQEAMRDLAEEYATFRLRRVGKYETEF